MTKQRGWIGVDLDGTIAHYDGWHGERHIGPPIMPMVERVKQWLADGEYDVRIFTARMASPHEDERREVAKAILEWTREHIGVGLSATCQKDYQMVALWDDRAVQVIPNTGIALQEILEAQGPPSQTHP